MVIEAIGSGILLGLSTGLFCLASCAPIIVSFMLGEEREHRQNIRIIIEIACGRLGAYLLIGLLTGLFAAELEGELFHRIGGVALILVSLLLLYSTISMIPFRFGFCRCIPKVKSQTPLLFGFLTGINVCPPFLLAISYAIAISSIIGSVLLFLGFFLGTSIYLLLLIPVGFAGRFENARIVGRITAVLSSLLFLLIGIGYVAG
ncbi:MAG: sulfite exporter TauE/SafE family protein [Methanospirillum sp.]|uniref:sulfite exporter TauE/SafE family protein n=1 Tax=Methanospirillum sp. TaxID=45200 RepID=UPI0023732D4F|nr:sulfite exporter TauE/SafE family protein [Methanospirillum sp.]MDD1729760.1 sulfite exporter TauE/SafE family protein [Methanospirillum sp.]